MANKTTINISGIGILGMMFLIMFTLKLCDIILFSWWIVTAPLWILPVTGAIVIISTVIVFLAGAIFLNRKS